MKARSAAFSLGFVVLCLVPAWAADAPPQGKEKDPLAGDAVLDAMIRRQQGQASGAKEPQSPRLKPSTAALPEDTQPLSEQPEAELDALLEQMEKVRTKINKLECDLVHRKQVPLFEIDDEFRGALKFRTPRLLRMELAGPLPKEGKKPEQRTTITIVSEDYAYIWRVEDKEAERFKLPTLEDKKFSERNPLEYGLAADVRNLKRDYLLNLRGKEEIDGRQTYKLVAGPKPQLKDPPYKRLYFWIDAETWLPIRFRQVKSDGEVVETYTLSRIKLNPTWLFTDPFARPPRSVHVIAHDLEEPRK